MTSQDISHPDYFRIFRTIYNEYGMAMFGMSHIHDSRNDLIINRRHQIHHSHIHHVHIVHGAHLDTHNSPINFVRALRTFFVNINQFLVLIGFTKSTTF